MADVSDEVEEKPKTGRARKAGVLCVVCHEPIPVLDMLRVEVTGRFSIADPDLPQLLKYDALHADCVQPYIAWWKEG